MVCFYIKSHTPYRFHELWREYSYLVHLYIHCLFRIFSIYYSTFLLLKSWQKYYNSLAFLSHRLQYDLNITTRTCFINTHTHTHIVFIFFYSFFLFSYFTIIFLHIDYSFYLYVIYGYSQRKACSYKLISQNLPFFTTCFFYIGCVKI